MSVTQQHSSPLLWLPNTFRAFYGAFPGLHKIQEQAIVPILQGRDLVLESATGTGKSEAVLAPSLERVICSNGKTAVLYIIPTKALAHDLKRRFERVITERLGLNLAVRTGDSKRRGGNCPDIMFTTPESLDVMLGSSNEHLKGFLARVGIVIIDEVHPLIHQYRGSHLACLLVRLEKRSCHVLQKIAMSATIAHVDSVLDFFNFSPQTVHITAAVKRKIHSRLIFLKQEETEMPALLNDLYTAWHYRKIIVFANSRSACDRLFGIVNQTGKFKGVCELHYSNLKLSERKRAEKKFRKNFHALCIATSTLELGIDVGDVDAVLLYEPPGSIAAFLQRIGRSNRRKKDINFWGICRGERASVQVTRFLALLELSCQGIVEFPIPRTLPSVLSQQVISCLYEKKQIALSSLTALFPEHHKILPAIFTSLEKKGWLRQTPLKGLLQGGWQYRNHLFDYKIWANFPEAEEEYVLEVSGQPLADLPKSIVGQMEVGDRVNIAGKCLKILTIDTRDLKKVVARPSKNREEKELAWIGTGAPVSFEVSQAMGRILSIGRTDHENCLFSRTQRLFRQVCESAGCPVVLENGIDVVPGKKAPYYFRTFLGTAGNLVLEWCIRETVMDEDLFISSDEIGLESSVWIRFEDLPLPANKEEFLSWVKRHLKIVAALIPLNLFCKTLPKHLLIEEVTDFLFDLRVVEIFCRYLETASTIISGNKDRLESWHQVLNTHDHDQASVAIDIIPKDSLLRREQLKIKNLDDKKNIGLFNAQIYTKPCQIPECLTGTMISEYFFYAQCKRRLCFKFMGLASLIQNPGELKTALMNQGTQNETKVLEQLKNQGENIIFMNTTGSFDRRFKEFLTQLTALISNAEHFPVFLSQCLLQVESVDCNFDIKGLGIPDLLVLTSSQLNGKKQVVIEVGDIKGSKIPRYHHKWQVAFYALLLEKILGTHGISARVAPTGFIITPAFVNSSGIKEEGFQRHGFDLAPYMASFPALLTSMSRTLSSPALAADHQLLPGCVACDWFFPCYHHALENEEIQFLPQVSPGQLLKIRQKGWSNIVQTRQALEKIIAATDEELKTIKELQTGLSQAQVKQLVGSCRAFEQNRIFLSKEKTRLFPDNISFSFFICLKKDPMTHLPCALGWQVLDQSFLEVESHIWVMENKKQMQKVWHAFSERISILWEKSISNNKGPHIFHFGSASRYDLLEWGQTSGRGRAEFLWQTQPSPWTDLKRVFTEHFYMPCPAIVSLFFLGHVFGCQSQIEQPQSFFHEDVVDTSGGHDLESNVKSTLQLMTELYAKARLYLKSQWNKEWKTILPGKEERLASFLEFIQEEQRLKENDIFILQELTLQERIAWFRAMGFLKFCNTRLDHEGRFLYVLKTSLQTCASKFRVRDFLKLVPHGVDDIQQGFSVIMAEYDMDKGEVSLLSRSGRLALSKRLLYSLEEDADDWNQTKLNHAADFIFSQHSGHPVEKLIAGQALDFQPPGSLSWLKKWLKQIDPGLNPAQQHALALAFQYRTSLIQGPPGTGKTHVLGWILIALIMQAHEDQKPLRIGVSALTHQAIDNVLKKVALLANQYFPGRFPGHCIKWGSAQSSDWASDWSSDLASENFKANACYTQVEFSDNTEDILNRPLLILGATGYGLYNFFNGKEKRFPAALDWVIFDEASQVPVPQALLSLAYGRGNFIFLGDIHQLPPVVMGNYANTTGPDLNQSILKNLMGMYPQLSQVVLDTTFRMNKEICEFPSNTWYQGRLFPASGNARTRLILNGFLDNASKDHARVHEYDKILDPELPVVLVLTDHKGCAQTSETEADLMAGLAHRLLMFHDVQPDQMALISPYRAQNNTVRQKLEEMLGKDKDPGRRQNSKQLPVVDTIERIQGDERDIIIFGITSSDLDHLLTDFLNSPHRLNVAMTRAKTKLIIIGSQTFFSVLPNSEAMLDKNYCFKALLNHCQNQNSVIVLS